MWPGSSETSNLQRCHLSADWIQSNSPSFAQHLYTICTMMSNTLCSAHLAKVNSTQTLLAWGFASTLLSVAYQRICCETHMISQQSLCITISASFPWQCNQVFGNIERIHVNKQHVSMKEYLSHLSTVPSKYLECFSKLVCFSKTS